MSKSIYVGNLNYKVTKDELSSAFGDYGEVLSTKIIMDHDGRSKGFGFIEMGDTDMAKSAVSALDGSDFMGRTLRVSPAKSRTRD